MINFKKIVLVILVLIAAAGVVCAQDKNQGQETQNTGGPPNVLPDEQTLSVDTTGADAPNLTNNISSFTLWDVLRMVLVLGAVLGVIYLLFYLLKKAARPVKDSGTLIDLLATRNLTNSSAVHLIKVGSQIFLVGAGDAGVRLVSEITDKETLDRIALEKSADAGGSRSFAEVLRGVFKGESGSSSKGISGKSFIREQKERLKNL